MKMLLIHMDKSWEAIEAVDAHAYLLGRFDLVWKHPYKFDKRFIVHCEDGAITSEHKYNPIASALLDRYILGDAIITKEDSNYNIISMEEYEIERFKRVLNSLVTVDENAWKR